MAANPLQAIDDQLRYGLIDHVFPVVNYTVSDGDTVRVVLDGSFRVRFEYSCRVAAVDCPESNTDAGKAVTAAVRQWFGAIPAGDLRCVSTDIKNKFAGRFLGTFVDRRSPAETLSHWLLNQQLARPYGGERRREWGADELAAIESRAVALAA